MLTDEPGVDLARHTAELLDTGAKRIAEMIRISQSAGLSDDEIARKTGAIFSFTAATLAALYGVETTDKLLTVFRRKIEEHLDERSGSAAAAGAVLN